MSPWPRRQELRDSESRHERQRDVSFDSGHAGRKDRSLLARCVGCRRFFRFFFFRGTVACWRSCWTRARVTSETTRSSESGQEDLVGVAVAAERRGVGDVPNRSSRGGTSVRLNVDGQPSRRRECLRREVELLRLRREVIHASRWATESKTSPGAGVTLQRPRFDERSVSASDWPALALRRDQEVQCRCTGGRGVGVGDERSGANFLAI